MNGKMTRKERLISFVWQHVLLFMALCIMTLGIALCVKSMLGASVISVLPYVFHDAGTEGLTPPLTIGLYTFLMNALLVVGQVGVLRRQFDPVQLFQLLVGLVFGMLIDLNLYFLSWLQPVAMWEKAVSQLAGCTILAAGISLEVRCGSVTMPGEGFPVALSKVMGIEFPKVKIAVDISLVLLGVVFSYLFFGKWQWHIIGVGTLFAMYYVGCICTGSTACSGTVRDSGDTFTDWHATFTGNSSFPGARNRARGEAHVSIL